ncbi:hypothetical protein CVT26_013876 [Gymnopilus dilepis]|uniref:Transmembrane protein n=1 Tax=Gymnopilus dilepis TaxID=231916 RepID=A0A409Y615_9AGAR|nr:hypothetical protein CVT26_013876 [Gymnopilus dilepis]
MTILHVETVQSIQENLSTLAVIAQVITYSIQSNSARLEVAVNALFFAGLLLDIFGGYVAYFNFNITCTATRRLLAIDQTPGSHCSSHSSVGISRCHHVLYETVRALENVHKDNRLGGQVYVDLHVYRHTASELTDKHRSKSNVANLSVALIRSVVFIGVLALVVGLLCYLESQQSLGVWITAFVVLGVLCALFQLSPIGKVADDLTGPDASLYGDYQHDMAEHAPQWRFSLHDLESIKSMQDDLNALALIATFLAAVQAQVNSYSFDSNSTKLEVAVNAMFFVGLLLDVLGGCVAYVVAVQLQHVYSLLSRRKTSIAHITTALRQYATANGTETPSKKETQGKLSSVCMHIKFLENLLLGGFNKKSSWKKTLPRVRQCRSSIQEIARLLDGNLNVELYRDLQEYQDTTNELDKARLHMNIAFSSIFVIRAVVFGGVVCLVLGLLCYVLGEQPVSVWIAFVTTLGGFLGLCSWIVVSSAFL